MSNTLTATCQNLGTDSTQIAGATAGDGWSDSRWRMSDSVYIITIQYTLIEDVHGTNTIATRALRSTTNTTTTAATTATATTTTTTTTSSPCSSCSSSSSSVSQSVSQSVSSTPVQQILDVRSFKLWVWPNPTSIGGHAAQSGGNCQKRLMLEQVLRPFCRTSEAVLFALVDSDDIFLYTVCTSSSLAKFAVAAQSRSIKPF